MLREIPSTLLSEWMAFYQLEPFGYRSDYEMHALIASVLAEINRNPKKKHEAYKIEDFMPKDLSVEEDKPSVFKKLKEFFKKLKEKEEENVNSGNS